LIAKGYKSSITTLFQFSFPQSSLVSTDARKKGQIKERLKIICQLHHLPFPLPSSIQRHLLSAIICLSVIDSSSPTHYSINS
jgi:hypothetical protein